VAIPKEVENMENFLIKQETYLEAGIHIGAKLKTIDMRNHIYRMRNDGLFVLDLRKIDERIRLAGKLLAQYAPEDVLVVASRTYSGNAASVFSSLTGIKIYQGRFIPGILTNVARDDFVEPKLIVICDPKGEHQAVIEAGNMGIPTIGLCDSDNSTTNIDMVVPCNNKGRRSLALIFYLFSREYLMGRGKIASYDEFSTPLTTFEAEKMEEAPAAAATAPQAESLEAAAQTETAVVEEKPSEAHKHAEHPKKKEEAPEEASEKETSEEKTEKHHKKNEEEKKE
jgi:small subunit ribosomal protein S2